VEEIHEAGDHFLVVGRVIDLESNDGEPLVFYRGGFGTFRV
jgi:3-hydroxy-9,10-secoandrosta-1,3,5(10)-triene-9,17-dione monooxygenase reductase component